MMVCFEHSLQANGRAPKQRGLGSHLRQATLAAVTVTSIAIAPVVGAQAQEGEGPELYGQAHMSLNYFDREPDDPEVDGSGFGVSSNSSRFGIRGSQPLNGFLTGIYQLELGVEWTGSGGGTPYDGGDFWTQVRNSYVGVEGDFGTLRIGRLPAANEFVYDSSYLVSTVGDVGLITHHGIGGRFSGALRYDTPATGPLSATATFVPAGSSDASDDVGDHDFLVRGVYDDGTLSATLTFVGIGADDAEGNGYNVMAVGGGYNFGAGEIGVLYSARDDDRDELDNHAVALGGALDVGERGSVRVQLAQFLGDADDADSLSAAVGYYHGLSDVTQVYGVYARTNNDDNQANDTVGYGHGGTPQALGSAGAGTDPQALSVGVIHSF